MAITYPRELISYHLTTCAIDLEENTVSAISKGYIVNISQVVPEVWRNSVVTGLLQPATQVEWSAWKKSLKGGMFTYLAYDLKRRNPGAYPNAKQPSDISGAWSGTASVSALTTSTISLATLPTTYQIRAGDRIGLEQSGKYGYYEILENVTASGGAATVTVFPFVHTTLFNTSAVARIWRPKCQFILDWNTWVEPETNGPGVISFEGYSRP